MLKSKKHVFWEALLITVVVFLVGLFLGMLIESGNSEKVSQLYLNSEISLVDGMGVTFLLDRYDIDCESIKEENIKFADSVFEEAKLLAKYEERGDLTNTMEILHKKYDLLRTLIWTSNLDTLNRCDNYNLVVYIYEYNTQKTDIKAMQNVWSNLLGDLKGEREDVLLIPIAGNQNITSMSLLMAEYGVDKLPAVVVNNKEVLYELEELSNIESLLK